MLDHDQPTGVAEAQLKANSMQQLTAQSVLTQTFGFDSFRGKQQEIIEQVISGGDALVLMPTGAGKSLCYQIPAIVREGTGIVISPLIALMNDQVSALNQLGVKAAMLNSSMDAGQQNTVEKALLEGNLDLLYIAPERLASQQTINLLKQTKLSIIAIDEAHCVSQWGHDFRPDYLRLDIFEQLWPEVPRIALTATATPQTHDEISNRLGLTEAKHFVSSFDRPNIRYQIVAKDQVQKQLLDFVRTEHSGHSGIVYALSRKRVEQTAKMLQSSGINAVAYHAGMNSAERSLAQSRFLTEDGIVVVATIAFGMGIDKPDVRFVAHIDLPKSIEGYYQETGRAGRDAKPSDAWLAYGLADVVQQRQFIEMSNGNQQTKQNQTQHLNWMLGLCESVRCRRKFLLNYFGEDAADSCGNCDICADPPTMWDATIPSQKILSTVLRTEKTLGQSYAAGQHIDVLRGVESFRSKQMKLDELSTWGIGADLSRQQWRGVVRHLLVTGMLDARGEWGVLALTEKALPVLRGEEQVQMRQEIILAKRKKSAASNATTDLNERQAKIFESLRTWRLAQAKAQEVPSYIVFNDATLKALAVAEPKNADELLEITGIGKAKQERYGSEILEVLAAS